MTVFRSRKAIGTRWHYSLATQDPRNSTLAAMGSDQSLPSSLNTLFQSSTSLSRASLAVPLSATT